MRGHRGVAGAIVGAVLVALAVASAGAAEPPPIRVGSKSFTESYILAELIAQILGGTGIVYGALANGDIDIYPEYTGTISQAILRDPSVTSLDAIRQRLRPLGLTISAPLGFANTYALAVRRDTATRLGLRTIGDLRGHARLRAAFDPGFLERDDGWSGLRRHYGLRLADVRIMEHALTYPALASGRVDVIDVFSTDGQLARLDLVLLADDARFFPDYSAVLLARRAVVERFPRTWSELERQLGGRLDAATMARLNARADLERRSFADVAASFLGRPRPAAA